MEHTPPPFFNRGPAPLVTASSDRLEVRVPGGQGVRREDWTLDLMRETVEEALDIAKMRMVDLPSLERAGHFLPALYLGLNLQGVTVATDFQEGTGVRLA